MAQSVSQFGDRVTELALPLIAVVALGASATQVGLLTAAVWLPYLSSFLVGSWVEEQRRKRRILVGADVARVVILASLPVAWFFGVVTLAQVFAVALLNGLGEVFFNTASPTVFVGLVPRRFYLQANSALSTTRSASFIAGPALGGVLIQALGAPVAVLVDACSFLGSALLLSWAPVNEPARLGDQAARARRGTGEGLRFIVRHPLLRANLAASTTVNLFSLMANGLLVLFASRTLGLSAAQIGLALGIGATGGLIGAVAASVLSRRLGIGPIMVFGAIVYPAAFALVAFASGPQLVKLAFLAGTELIGALGVMFFDITSTSLNTSLIPDELRSRVGGAFSTVNYGVRPLGAAIGGLLGSTIGLRPTLVIAAVGGSLGCLWLLASPIARLHNLEELGSSRELC